MAKANEIERAAYEVEVYRNRVAQLVSIHREDSCRIDWQRFSSASAPQPPQRSTAQEESARHRFESYQPGFIARLLRRVDHERSGLEREIDRGRDADEAAYRESCAHYEQQHSEWREQKEFAARVLSGDHAAYLEAIKEVNPFAEIGDLGSAVKFEIVSQYLIKADIFIHGESAVPRESKSLLKSGKLSVKQTPKSEFYRLYQDYICSCVLRVARELFAILPVETLVVSAVDDLVNSSTGHLEKQPILSVLIPRQTFARLKLDLIDPSESMKNFVHQMEFKATTGFRPVERISTEGFMHAP